MTRGATSVWMQPLGQCLRSVGLTGDRAQTRFRAMGGFVPERIVASFHGMPERTLKLGDPYHCQCMKTGRLLRETLGLAKDKFMVCFQSRFGNEEWLKPYLIDTMGELPAKGIKKVLVIAPGFADRKSVV